eukprot:SAG31_NODE_1046_length_10177_cov_13.677218_5_plen_106_part_00
MAPITAPLSWLTLCCYYRAAEKKARGEAKKLKEAKAAEKEKGKKAKAAAGGSSLADLEKKLMPLVKRGDALIEGGDLAAGLALYQEAMVRSPITRGSSVQSAKVC